MALDLIITKLRSTKRWPLIIIVMSALLSLFFTTIMNMINSLIWWGRIDRDLILIGCIDALAVPLFVAPMIVYILRHTLDLADVNRSLQEEIDERKDTERALKESESRLRVITENMVDAVSQIDEKGKIRYVSPSITRVFGYTPADLLSRLWMEHIHKDDLDRIREEISKAADGKATALRIEYQYRHADGHYCWVESEIRLLYGEEGQLTSSILSLRDIAKRKHAEIERKKFEDLLQQAQKMEALGMLAGGVAHDLNNILGGIVGFPDLLLMQLPESSPLRSSILVIKDSGERAAAVVQDLLTLARRNTLSDKVFNINDVVMGYLSSLACERLRQNHQDVHLDMILAPDLLNIKGSPVHFDKIAMNLFSNAFESITGSGQVTVTTENIHFDKTFIGFEEIAAGDYVRLRITDTGAGISSRDLERIFEPFYTKKNMGISGTGLGLAVVWAAVKDLHGFIDVQSQVGKGSVFSLYLPITREAIPSEEAAIPIDACRSRGESILVIDDVEQQRKLAAGILSELGYHVHTAASGEEAVEYLKTNQADLIILDMIMEPGMDGLETYRQILLWNKSQKAIIVSGFSETDRVEQTRALGAGAYVRKPYLVAQLCLAVRRELDRTA